LWLLFFFASTQRDARAMPPARTMSIRRRTAEISDHDGLFERTL
jgi:hypothetical protein